MAVIKDATKADLLDTAMALPYDERLELVEELEASLHPPPGPPMTKEQFRAELDRRWEDYKSGKVKMMMWEEVKEKARMRLNRHD